MITMESLRIWNVRRQFAAIRPGFYRDLGAALKSNASLRDLIGRYATANAGALSEMMMLWKNAYARTPDSLARATRPFVVATDSVVINAAEQSNQPGDLYQTYARNLLLRAKMLKVVKTPLILPFISLLALIGAYGFFKFSVFDKLAKDIKPEFWASSTKLAYNTVSFVWSWQGGVTLGVLFAAMIWTGWSFANFTHPIRQKLDRRGVWKVFAQMEMLSALSVLAALIKAGRSDVESISLIQSNSSPWMRSVLNRVKTYTNQKGTPVLSSLIKADVPISPVLAARIEVLASQALPKDMPDLVITACEDEAESLCDRMDGLSKGMVGLTTMFLAVAIGIVMLGIFGMQESARNMTAAHSQHRH